MTRKPRKPVFLEIVPGRRYPPVGRCIYCSIAGSTAKLGKEHIIPLALGGTLILPKASCQNCGAITGNIEQSLTKFDWSIFRPIRSHLKLPSRRPKGQPTSLPVWVEIEDRSERRHIPIAKHPPSITLPIYTVPHILLGLPPDAPAQGKLRHVPLIQDTGKFVEELDAKKIHLGFRLNDGEYLRFIAKIAHSYAVAELGLSAIRPWLPEIILGRDPHIFNLVGGTDRRDGPFPGQLHRLQLYKQAVQSQRVLIVNRVVWITEIQLFAAFAGPTYYAVVGEPI